MPLDLPPPPRKEDARFDNWVFTLWKRAVGALVSGGVGVTAPITITTSGTGTVNIGHGTSGVVTGTYGGTLGVPQVVVDTYGHITAGTSLPLQATAPILAGSNAGTFTFGHSTSGVVATTYGGTAGLPQVVVDTFGHITSAANLLLQATAPILLGSNAGTYTWGHSTSGVVPGTYGGSGVTLAIAVDTWGHVTAASTFASAAGGKWTPWPYIVTATDTLSIDDGEQMIFAQQVVVNSGGDIVVSGTGQLHIL